MPLPRRFARFSQMTSLGCIGTGGSDLAGIRHRVSVGIFVRDSAFGSQLVSLENV